MNEPTVQFQSIDQVFKLQDEPAPIECAHRNAQQTQSTTRQCPYLDNPPSKFKKVTSVRTVRMSRIDGTHPYSN
jgi:hypothetical protein